MPSLDAVQSQSLTAYRAAEPKKQTGIVTTMAEINLLNQGYNLLGSQHGLTASQNIFALSSWSAFKAPLQVYYCSSCL